MKRERKEATLGFWALLIAGLFFSLLLVFILDGARLLAPKEEVRMMAEILLEEMDGATAAALREESALTPEGGSACRLLQCEAPLPQMRQCTTADGRILFLPSENRFCARIVLEITGTPGEDGFLAFGSLPLRTGARIRYSGERISCEGLLLSLSAF